MKNKTAKPKILKSALKIAVFSVVLAFFVVIPVSTKADEALFPGGVGSVSPYGSAITTISPGTEGSVKKFSWQNFKDNLKKFTWDKVLQELKKAGDIAWKAALKNFLNTLAYDMATYLATGDKGQLPMFQTQGWGGYLKDVADNAAGTFIEQLGKNSPIRFNLCSSGSVMLRINLGLFKSARPKKPDCTFSQLEKNWEAALSGKDFLPKFQDMFNPWSNDLGVALTVQTSLGGQVERKVNEAIKDRVESGGFKSVTDAISGTIKTPGNLVRYMSEDAAGAAKQSALAYTGSVVADSIDIFINTLAGKLMTNWLRGGLVTKFPKLTNKLDSLTDPNAQNPAEGLAGAQNRLKTIVEPNFRVRADYDILAELTACPDPNKAGPTDCVIDEKFRQAIEKKMTVGQALTEGYLNGDGIFGFNSAGLEPMFPAVYPYRSMIILRKYRIIPVGWEVAAQKIKDLQGEGGVDGTKNLNDLVNCFSDKDDYGAVSETAPWCEGLVDPDWVLKAPQNFCKREGAGPEIISQQVIGQGADSSLAVLRDDAYCADEQSVITEKSDGSPVFGYCTAERRKWDFNARGCSPLNNTCQTFSSADGQTNSYLQNTLDFGVCDLTNAGCQKYAVANSLSYDSAARAVNWKNSSQAIHLNKQAESCEAESEGCRGLIRVTPREGETYDSIISGGVDNAYNRFSSTGLIHERILPDYLMNVCYNDKVTYYEPKSNAPAVCASFARRCKKDEAGCELYTNVLNQTKIPAKVTERDYCPAECVGYSTFVQGETFFDHKREAYFIPRTAKTCSAEAAGCDEFTNLEKVSTTTPNAAEQKEYYTYLRQCLKKSEAPAAGPGSCGDFYSWEGSDESGFQLKVQSLKLDIDGDDTNLPASAQYVGDPAVSSDDSTVCSEAIYNLPLNNPAYNPDCRQFYSKAGGVSYHLYSRTIICSDDCHPYRRTENNVDENITVAANCAGADKYWDSASSQCLVCKNGGVWSTDNNACVYMAVSKESVTCAAQANGCREYTGNTGNDIRNIFTDDFEADATTGAWLGYNAVVSRSNDSIILQNNQGHSLLVSVSNNDRAGARRPVGGAVTRSKAYVLSFLAKAAAGTVDLDISLATSTTNGLRAEFAPIKNAGSGWQIYKTSLIDLNHAVTADEFILIESGGDFYIDNIALTEITDRYYLIKNSWRTPSSCDQDQAGQPAPHYMLGCDQYKDRAGKIHNLKQFARLCADSAVGCELMMDTRNSSQPGASFYKDGKLDSALTSCTGVADCVQVPADDFTYAIYDSDKLCGADEKGCELLGRAYQYEQAALYGDVYLKNNPDQYSRILCGADAVGCDAFAYDNGAGGSGEKYFKDPGDQICEYRQQMSGAGTRYGWYKKKIKRCDDGLGLGEVNGKIDASGDPLAPVETNICLSDADCSIVTGAKHYSCLADSNDYGCPSSDLKTLGLGGVGGEIVQPSADASGNKWAGICAEADSGCAEYIDPLSRFNTNTIFNGSFQKIAFKKTDGWAGAGAGPFTQTVTLEPNTVYRLGRLKQNNLLPNALSVDCPAGTKLYKITSAYILSSPAASLSVSIKNYENSEIFYYQGGEPASCTVSAGSSAGAVELKKVAIDYQLAQNLDSRSCNGIVNPGQGCVLFNERKLTGRNLAALTFDADTSDSGKPPAAGAVANDNDSNIILKVAPDRVCDQWLACKSYIKDAKGNNVCFDVGLCDAVDQNGDCQSFIPSPKANQTVGAGGNLDAAGISNFSGYSKAGISGGTLKTDYYPFGAMEQKGEVANFSNGGFEYYGANLYPVGWNWTGAAAASQSWNPNIFSVVSNPIAAQTEGVGYAPEGASFLKLGSSYTAMSEPIDVIKNTDYTITAYLNTKNLKSGQAKIDIVDKDYENGDPAIAGGIIIQELGNDWNFQMGKFNTGANSQIKIKLYSSADGTAASEGNFYYDDIKIRPALNSKTKSSDCLPGYCISNNDGDNGLCSNKSQPCLVSHDEFWYTPQSCRLYPQSDSLSCDYFEDSGIRQKGWPGYCLEYDRRPGDPNTCLLWYPIDKVKGDGIEEGAGYAGKFPLYYCTESTPSQSLNATCKWFKQGASQVIDLKNTYTVWSETNDRISVTEGGANGSKYGLALRDYITQEWSNTVTGTIDGRFRTWDVSAVFSGIKIFDAVKITCINGDGHNDSCECSSFTSGSGIMNAPRCQKIAQTVNSVGNNKFWSSKVYLGSDYKVNPCNLENPNASQVCTYDSDSPPFGSIVPPASSQDVLSNPYEWDTYPDEKVAPGNQPLFYRPEGSTEPRLGQTIESDKLKRLFAQSYGVWQWQEGTYLCSTDSTKNAGDVCNNQSSNQFNDCPYDVCSFTTVERLVCQDDNLGCRTPSDCVNNQPCLPKDVQVGICSKTLSLPEDQQIFCRGQYCENGTCRNQDKIPGGHYVPAAGVWEPPTQECLALNGDRMTVRFSNPLNYKNTEQDYCAIRPVVSNIKVNSAATDYYIRKNGFINLTFNSKVDSNQLPMVMYAVDWGDGSNTMVTGVEMRDKANSENPEIIYHLYSYWDLKAKDNSGAQGAGITCLDDCSTRFAGAGSAACCYVTPKVQIKDNWGWCSGGSDINDCDNAYNWRSFDGSVIVKEK